MKLFLTQQAVLSSADKLVLAQTLPSSTVRNWVLKALAVDTDVVVARLTLRWVDEPEGRELNRIHRGLSEGGLDKDYATNVLTFAYGMAEDEDSAVMTMSADIVLCWSVLVAEAAAQGKILRHHAAHLIIHGVLHALGFDHETDAEAEAMENLEIQLLATLKMANPYLV